MFNLSLTRAFSIVRGTESTDDAARDTYRLVKNSLTCVSIGDT